MDHLSYHGRLYVSAHLGPLRVHAGKPVAPGTTFQLGRFKLPVSQRKSRSQPHIEPWTLNSELLNGGSLPAFGEARFYVTPLLNYFPRGPFSASRPSPQWR